MKSDSGKKEAIRRMFDKIAPRYDILNRVLSAGIDQSWRRSAIKIVDREKPSRILDIATGTADLAIMAADTSVDKIVGVDIAEEMLEIGRSKIQKRGLEELIELLNADAENLPFSDRQFDVAMVAFGVRNFENLREGLSEIRRVLKPGGKAVILEFSRPRVFPVKQLYSLYGRYILPGVGKSISGDDGAYTYLPESIAAFPDGDDFLDEMMYTGFKNVAQQRLTLGIATIYTGSAD